MGTVRKRLSTAAARANATLLLARMGQVGEGSGLAGNRRAWQRQEERRMQLQKEAYWQIGSVGSGSGEERKILEIESDIYLYRCDENM